MECYGRRNHIEDLWGRNGGNREAVGISELDFVEVSARGKEESVRDWRTWEDLVLDWRKLNFVEVSARRKEESVRDWRTWDDLVFGLEGTGLCGRKQRQWQGRQ